MDTVISIDAGNVGSGIVILLNKKIVCGFNEPNNSVLSKISSFIDVGNTIVVIEDVRPYSKPLSMQTIDTIKYVGELQYRLLNELQLPFELITRSEVKQWIFDRFPLLCTDRVDKKIARLHEAKRLKGEKGYRNKDGTMRKASHNFVDDRIIQLCMQLHWGMVGKNKLGIRTHVWQALACASTYLDKKSPVSGAI